MKSLFKLFNKILPKIILFVSIQLLILGNISFQTSYAAPVDCDEEFYKLNAIGIYDPCEPCATSSSLTGNTNEERVFKWLVSNGFNAAQAAGMMGNINTESSFNPFRMQTTYSDSGLEAVLPIDAHSEYNKAFGLVQWDGGRRQQVLTQIQTKFPDYVTLINTHGKSADGYKQAQNNMNEAFLTFELEFMLQELNSGYTSVLDAIKGQPDTEEGVRAVTEIWNRKYEVSGDYTQERHNKAVEFYNQFKASAASISPASGTTSDGADSGCDEGGGPAGEVVWYSQCDPKWADSGYAGSTMCAVGCGPTSMAIILASLIDKNITPPDVAAVAGAQDGGTSSWGGLIEGVNAKWGLSISTQPLTMDEAVEFVKSGKGYVWLGGSGPPPFTAGHLVAMVGVTPDGQVTIADPYGDGPGHQRIANYPLEQIDASVNSGIFGVPKK